MIKSNWQLHVEKWRDCSECTLCTQRSRIVLGRGQVPADVVFVGEAPGDSEDVIGQPFVGSAGKLLDEVIRLAVAGRERALRLAFTNLVCCFPKEAKQTDNHQPAYEEIKACAPRLGEFIEVVARPEMVVCVGDLAKDCIGHAVNFSRGGASMNPTPVPESGIVNGATCVKVVIQITHPAAILRMPEAQKGMAARQAMITLQSAFAGYFGA